MDTPGWATEPRSQDGETASAQGQKTTSPTAKILIVEDDAAMQMLLTRLLQRLGVACDIAQDGQKGLALWQENKYQAIIMDCQMPVMNGFEAAATIREMEQNATRTPIIALTADLSRETQLRCLALGMDDCLTKPLDFARLEKILRRQLVFRKTNFAGE